MSSPRLPETFRRLPAKGVHVSFRGPNWVFLTVYTINRKRWLAQPTVQCTLHDIWKNDATAWLVSDYLLMPDHPHLFCAPHDPRIDIEPWISFWKDQFAKTHPRAPGKFQRNGFHHRLRSNESYSEKWHYVQNNPVRKGLAARPEDWPFCGRVHDIGW